MTNKNTVTPAKYTGSEVLAGVNWNDIQDPTDKLLWDRMTSAFWLPEKFRSEEHTSELQSPQ